MAGELFSPSVYQGWEGAVVEVSVPFDISLSWYVRHMNWLIGQTITMLHSMDCKKDSVTEFLLNLVTTHLDTTESQQLRSS